MNTEQMPQQEGKLSLNTSLAIALVLGLLIGFIIGNMSAGKFAGGNGAALNNASSTQATGSNNTSNSPYYPSSSQVVSSTTTVNDFITVPDQLAGNTVVISDLNLDKTYWVAIRDHKESTLNPKILGAKKFFKGDFKNVSIYVSRATVQGQYYDVVFYNDSPDFNYSQSNIVMDGSVIRRATFKAQ